MSTTASRGTGHPRDSAVAMRAYACVMSVAVLAALSGAVVLQRSTIGPKIPSMVAWAALVAIADLLPVWFLNKDVSFSFSLPLTLAAGMVLGAVPAAIVAAVGSMDPRELRRQITPSRAAYNRSQVTVSVWAASTVFHAFGVSIVSWPLVMVPVMAALVTDFLVNMTLVAIMTGWRLSLPLTGVLRSLFGDSPVEYISGYLSFGCIAILQALTFRVAGLWGLLAWLAPMWITRRSLIHAQGLVAASRRIEDKDRALLEAGQRLSEERRDERMVLAGELHDEILPPLFKVHLMGQVLRQDLSAGRLFELDEDLPQLIEATEVTQSAVRALVGGLRQSPIGAGGLNSTLRLLIQQLESTGASKISADLEEVVGSGLSQLLVYQVAREALSNAIRHSRSPQIRIRLWGEDGLIRLMVQDEGVGFDPSSVDRTQHFGLQLLAERVDAAEGRVVIDSRLGEGTTILATVPADVT